jgi:hypothetical protein
LSEHASPPQARQPVPILQLIAQGDQHLLGSRFGAQGAAASLLMTEMLVTCCCLIVLRRKGFSLRG